MHETKLQEWSRKTCIKLSRADFGVALCAQLFGAKRQRSAGDFVPINVPGLCGLCTCDPKCGGPLPTTLI